MGSASPRQRLACIALGSNLGDRQAILGAAIRALGELPETTLVSASRLHETEPVGPTGQGPYLNAACCLLTSLSARVLLEHLLDLERRFGRVRRRRWGPRTLDLDLILLGDEQVDEEGLTVPHPRFRERGFVLTPLAEVAADAVDPETGKPVSQLARESEIRGCEAQAVSAVPI